MAYSVCIIKNTSGVEKTLRGKIFLANDTYQIPDSIRIEWASDDNVLLAIAVGEFKIYNSQGEIVGIDEQLKWLTQHSPIEAVTEYTSRYFMKGDGVIVDVQPNGITNIDLLLDNKQPESPVITAEAYLYKYIKGGTIFGDNIVLGDWAKFQVVDKDGWLVAAGVLDQQTFDAIKPVVLKEYVVKQYVHPTCAVTNTREADSPGKVPVGTYLRCQYNAVNSGTTRKIVINYDIQNKD